MTETTPLAPSTADAAPATERLAAWVISALTAIVIGGVAIVIYVPRGGHAGGSSWLPEINASLNGTATVLLSTGYRDEAGGVTPLEDAGVRVLAGLRGRSDEEARHGHGPTPH